MKRKVISVVAVILSVLALGGFAFLGTSFAAEIAGDGVLHYSAADLVENKAVYDMSFFDRVDVWVEVNGELSDQEKNSVGSLTVENGEYHYFDNNGNRVDVNGQSKTFDLVLGYEEPGYSEFYPQVYLKGAADGGLQGKRFTYSLLGVDDVSRVFPNFRTFSQQMATYVPYIERDSSGRNYTFRMVNPRDPEKGLSVPVSGRYRIRMYDRDNYRIFNTGWKDKEAGANPADTVVLPDEVNPADVDQIRVDFQLYENVAAVDYSDFYYYRWRFDVCTKTDAGIAANSDLFTPFSINVGEEVELKVTFDAAYNGDSSANYKPIIISDRTVLDNSSWNYDPVTKEGVFKLKGLKDGRASFAVAYIGDEDYNTSGWYHTTFTEVTVGGIVGGGSGSLSGGGCNALTGSFAALALGVAVLAIKKRG
jgi:hypothetical protein